MTTKKPGSFSQKFNTFIDEKLMPAFAKFSTEKHLVSIRDAFGIITPLVMAGSISLIFSIFLFGGSGGVSTSLLGWIAKPAGGISVNEIKDAAGNVIGHGNAWSFVAGSGWARVSTVGANMFGIVTDATLGIFSIFISFELAYVHARANKPKVDAVITGLVSLAAFAALARGFQGAHAQFRGASGLLIAMCSSFFVAYIFDKFSSFEKLKIKMPKEVPPAVAQGFSYIVPVFLTLVSVGFVDSFFMLIGGLADMRGGTQSNPANAQYMAPWRYGFAGMFQRFISAPFEGFANSSGGGLGIGFTYSLFVGFFWWFGINGSSVMNGVFYPILAGVVLKNMELVSNSINGYDGVKDQLGTVSITFLENYTQLTGWGMTGGLVIATFLFSKITLRRDVAKISAVPAIFGVNEPMTFGYPVMLNLIYAIPSIFMMAITTIFAWLVVDIFGWVRISYLQVPWTLPPGIGALLATGFDWRAMILAWVCLAISFGLYIPFVFLDNRSYAKMNKVSAEDEAAAEKPSDAEEIVAKE